MRTNTALVHGGSRLEYDTKETAAAIRLALKAAFPGCKFSVTTSYGSMYSATNVRWTDGPTEPEVSRIADRFSSKSFDGSDDSTHYHEQDVDGQRVQYSGWINVSRHVSDELRALATRKAALIGEENIHAVTYTLRPNGCVVTMKAARS